MELMKLLAAQRAPAGAGGDGGDRALLDPVLGGVPLLAGFASMAKVEGLLGLPPDPVRRLGALGVLVVEDAERLWQRLRLANVEHERLRSMADGWWHVRPPWASAASSRCSID